ncbi:hypothetical protein LZ30DRAFT_782324 [Colletotrichum cereale]|nr:hypothetical protein LZ30DRAFT_782324 [Colletotrichum cereale]
MAQLPLEFLFRCSRALHAQLDTTLYRRDALTCLYVLWATVRGDACDFASWLVAQSGFDVDALTDQGPTPLATACAAGQFKLAHRLLSLGADCSVGVPTRATETIIHVVLRACTDGQNPILEHLPYVMSTYRGVNLSLGLAPSGVSAVSWAAAGRPRAVLKLKTYDYHVKALRNHIVRAELYNNHNKSCFLHFVLPFVLTMKEKPRSFIRRAWRKGIM